MPVSVPVDFSGVEARTSVRVKEGPYIAKLIKIEKTNAKSGDRNPMLVCDFEFRSGGAEGLKIRDRHILTKESLWTLRNMLEAMGLKVPNGKMTLKEEQLVGRLVGLQVRDGEEYKGRIRSEVDDYLPKDAVSNLAEASSSVTEDDDDDDDWEEDEDVEDEEEAEDEEDEDESFGFTDDDEVADEEDDDFGFDDDEDEEEGDEETEELSFTEKDVREGKAAELKGYIKEAMEAGWEFDLPSKPKAGDVREALLGIFEGDDDDDDDELEGYSLEDV